MCHARRTLGRSLVVSRKGVSLRPPTLFNRAVGKARTAGVVLNLTVEHMEVAVAADPLSRVFAALADPTRRDMVARLAVADATVKELAPALGRDPPGRLQALKVLEDAALVSRRWEAQRVPSTSKPRSST